MAAASLARPRFAALIDPAAKAARLDEMVRRINARLNQEFPEGEILFAAEGGWATLVYFGTPIIQINPDIHANAAGLYQHTVEIIRAAMFIREVDEARGL